MSAHGRDYGYGHQQVRARLAPIVATGTARCARCGELIAPGAAWDLGHDDWDRTRYSGPEHRKCNRATAAHRLAAEPPGAVSYPLARDLPPNEGGGRV